MGRLAMSSRIEANCAWGLLVRIEIRMLVHLGAVYALFRRAGWSLEEWEEEGEGRFLTFFMFSASRSYSSRTSCSKGERSGGERSGLGIAWSIVVEYRGNLRLSDSQTSNAELLRGS